MTNTVRIAPSILAADFAHLADSIELVAHEIDMLHIDVMDGHFVPNISLGPPVLRSIRTVTDVYLDCHLMITDPLRYLSDMKAAGADGVSVHIEAVPDPLPIADEAKRLELDFGLVVNPDTPVDAVLPYLDRCSMLVIMSVEPGFGGQAFIEASLAKIKTLRESVDSLALSTDIQVDGGIDLQTAGAARRAGANVFVGGTSVFRADDPAAAVRELKAIVGAVDT